MENTKIVEQQRKANLKNQEIKLAEQSFVIFPFRCSGFIDYTNNGASQYNVRPEDFETFKRVWTGNDATVISWKDSVLLEQSQETKEGEIKYQLGEFLYGQLEVFNGDNEIAEDVSFEEYKSQQIRNTIVFRVNKTFNIDDRYLLMFYKIPELSNDTLYRIETIDRQYIGRELEEYVITFKTINQDLANTGRARQQNIMPNSPGQGYLSPAIYGKEFEEIIKRDNLVEGRNYFRFTDRYITGDINKTKNNPVRKAIVRILGNGVLHSVAFVGRPVLLGDDFKKFRPQRLIFPYNFEEPITPNLYHTQQGSNNMYFGDFAPTLEYWKDLMVSIKDSLTPVNQFNYEGWLKYDYSKLKSTNPIDNGIYKYSLFGFLDRTTSTTFLVPWEFNTDEKTIDLSGVYGVEQQYKIGGNKKIHDHLFDNFWTQKEIKVLPININQTLSFGWTLASSLAVGSKLVGGSGLASTLFSALLGAIGIVGTLASKLVPKKLQTFRGLISAPLIDFNNNLFQNTDTLSKIPFNMLDNNEKNTPNSVFFSGQTLTTGFQAKLTDLITSDRVDESKTLSTVNIGQKTFEDGTNILSSGYEFLLNGDAKLLNTYDEYSGFIIDSIKIQATCKCDISVEFLDINNEVIWSGIYQSQGKWTNSMREIWTEKNCSVFGRENVFFFEEPPYPKPIPEPPPSFPVAVQKTITTNEVSLLNSVSIGPGYATFVGRFNNQLPPGDKIPTTIVEPLEDYWWKVKNVNQSQTYTILENVSKEELLQNYSHIEFDIDTTSKKMITMYELFSQNGVFEIENNDEWIISGKLWQLAVGQIPIFPLATFDFNLETSRTFRIQLFYVENLKKLSVSISTYLTTAPYLDRVKNAVQLTGELNGLLPGGELFLFGSMNTNYQFGIKKIILYPK